MTYCDINITYDANDLLAIDLGRIDAFEATKYMRDDIARLQEELMWCAEDLGKAESSLKRIEQWADEATNALDAFTDGVHKAMQEGQTLDLDDLVAMSGNVMAALNRIWDEAADD